MCKVSIIIPVYNIPEQNLRKCIESVINQTLEEIEIILVDDGSTDSSGIICDEYATIDNRVKVIHKLNCGLSAARNTGFENAKGEWITFLDSDDWIEPHTCEETYKLGIENDVDIVIFSTIQEFGKFKKIFKYKLKNKKVYTKNECTNLQCEILNFEGNIATAWAKLYKREFLERNNLKHNEKLRQGSEGIEFNIRVFEKVQKVIFTNKIYYHYVFNPNSISAKHNVENHFWVIRCFEIIEKDIETSKNYRKLKEFFYDRFAYVIVATAISGYFSPNNHEKYKEKKKSFENYIKQDLVLRTLSNYNIDNVGKERAIVLSLIKKKNYNIITILALIRYIQKHRRL